MSFKVYEAIANVTAAMSKEGIAKGRKNQQQGYAFRGIDDVYNVLSPMLATHKLCILPRILSRDLIERQTARGGALFYVTVEAEFDFVSAEDGSKHTVRTFGEAMDSADKATNKAMSAAYKYAAMQAFCIPTEGDNDADATTHEVAPRNQPAKASAAEQKRGLDQIERELLDCRTPGDVSKLLNAWADDAEKAGWTKDYWDEARRRFARRKKEIETADNADDFPWATGTGIRDQSGRELSNMMAG